MGQGKTNEFHGTGKEIEAFHGAGKGISWDDMNEIVCLTFFPPNNMAGKLDKKVTKNQDPPIKTAGRLQINC